MTPRQIAGYLRYSQRRRRRELGDLLSVIATGTRGGKDDLKKAMKDLTE